MSLQDVGNCRVADRVPHFSEFTLDPIEALGWILFGELHSKIDDD